MTLGHPKPEPRVKEPKQLKRSKPPARTRMKAKRTKRIKFGNAYTDPEYRKIVAQVHKRSGDWCEYCGRAPRDGDPNHEEYAPFKGKKRVRVDPSKMKDACRPCHLSYEQAKREGKLHLFYLAIHMEMP